MEPTSSFLSLNSNYSMKVVDRYIVFSNNEREIFKRFIAEPLGLNFEVVAIGGTSSFSGLKFTFTLAGGSPVEIHWIQQAINLTYLGKSRSTAAANLTPLWVLTVINEMTFL